VSLIELRDGKRYVVFGSRVLKYSRLSWHGIISAVALKETEKKEIDVVLPPVCLKTADEILIWRVSRRTKKVRYREDVWHSELSTLQGYHG
jgi:hypothetical protein